MLGACNASTQHETKILNVERSAPGQGKRLMGAPLPTNVSIFGPRRGSVTRGHRTLSTAWNLPLYWKTST